MRFAIDVRRTGLPLLQRRRAAWRNSNISQAATGYPHHERWWLLGLDVTVDWGSETDPNQPKWSYRRSARGTRQPWQGRASGQA